MKGFADWFVLICGMLLLCLCIFSAGYKSGKSEMREKLQELCDTGKYDFCKEKKTWVLKED